MDWIEIFRRETAPVIGDPFLLCLAEAIAAVESDWGRAAIRADRGLNEIGYKAVSGRPSIEKPTREADAHGGLAPTAARFRLFSDRREQARALLWLLRSSRYYEVARLLFILAFYAAYAPGREAGAIELLKVFNQSARSGVHEGVRPLLMIAPATMDAETLELNHAAARQAVRLFAKLTASP